MVKRKSVALLFCHTSYSYDRLRAGRQRNWSSIPDEEKGMSSSLQAFTMALGPIQPPRPWVPGVKQPGHEVGHSRPFTTEVKNEESYTSCTPSYTSEVGAHPRWGEGLPGCNSPPPPNRRLRNTGLVDTIIHYGGQILFVFYPSAEISLLTRLIPTTL
jgi:hypothetical protein